MADLVIDTKKSSIVRGETCPMWAASCRRAGVMRAKDTTTVRAMPFALGQLSTNRRFSQQARNGGSTRAL